MKIQILAILVTSLISMTASAGWYVSRVSCFQNNPPDGQRALTTVVEGQKIKSSTYEGNYATKTRINPRSVWVGIFDIIEIYDGMNLEGGVITTAQGQALESRAEIRFKPFTDLAYGPDDATAVIYTKSAGQAAWSVLESFDDCSVSVYH